MSTAEPSALSSQSAAHPVVIIGAGLAGLACAKKLAEAGQPFVILESADAPGGRIRTDRVNPRGQAVAPDDQTRDAFRIDRGFQVYLSAYPEARRRLNHEALRLGAFMPGAQVRCEGRFWRVADPLRAPFAALPALLRPNPVMTVRDRLVLARMDATLRLAGPNAAWRAREQTSLSFLREQGLSPRVIERFFRPFFGGVFLDPSLNTSARKLRYLYRLFGRGRTALPAAGMQAIPDQLAASLIAGQRDLIRFNTAVTRVSPSQVTLADGTTLDASAVVIATDGDTACHLHPTSDVIAPRWQSVTTICFGAEIARADRDLKRIYHEPILMLNGEGTGPVNHVAVLSAAQPAYAPPGQALISAILLHPHPLEPTVDPHHLSPNTQAQVQRQMVDWFGSAAADWQHLRTDTIARALPDESVTEDGKRRSNPQGPETNAPGIFIAGDHRENGSINGAMVSGRRAADTLLTSLNTATVSSVVRP